jgi:signal transduction histidine kinase
VLFPGRAAVTGVRIATKAEPSPPPAHLWAPDRLRWAVRVRWLVIVGFLVLAVAAHAFGVFSSIAPCFYAAGVGAVLNTVNGWAVRRDRRVGLVTAIAIPADHVLTTYVVVNTGGVQSPFMMMYVVEVVATAMLVGTRVAAVSAAFAVLAWLVGIGLLATAHLQVPALFAPGATAHAGVSSPLYHGTWAAFLLYCLTLLVYLGGYISERLRSSERDVELKNQRLQEALGSLARAHAELTAAYERLKRTEAHLIQSEKMRSLGELVAGVAHELSNPISFVSANVEHLRRYVNSLARGMEIYNTLPLPPEERARFEATRRALRIEEALTELPQLLDDCEEGARRTKHIVNELRTFSRSDRQEAWEHADVHRNIESTLALLSHRLKDHIAVHRQFGDVPEVECLSGPLNQVFMNVLANAADAIGHNKGNVWIATGLSRIDLPSQAGTPAVTIVIRDDGAGISHEAQARIFDPFFTTKAAGQGTGLGLSVSYGIIQRHGGTLTVASAPGGGATFTITLPVKQPRAAAPGATS